MLSLRQAGRPARVRAQPLKDNNVNVDRLVPAPVGEIASLAGGGFEGGPARNGHDDGGRSNGCPDRRETDLMAGACRRWPSHRWSSHCRWLPSLPRDQRASGAAVPDSGWSREPSFWFSCSIVTNELDQRTAVTWQSWGIAIRPDQHRLFGRWRNGTAPVRRTGRRRPDPVQ